MTALYAQANYVDVFGGVKITLEVTSTEDDPAHPNRPRLHFTGSSDSGTSMAGWVAVTEHGDIRWHFVSTHCVLRSRGTPTLHRRAASTATTFGGRITSPADARERSRLRSSEGIQVGNVRSLFGVLGTWTTVTHDEHDPFGAFTPELLVPSLAHSTSFRPVLDAKEMSERHREARDASSVLYITFIHSKGIHTHILRHRSPLLIHFPRPPALTHHQSPCARIASATLMKPATFAPHSRLGIAPGAPAASPDHFAPASRHVR